MCVCVAHCTVSMYKCVRVCAFILVFCSMCVCVVYVCVSSSVCLHVRTLWVWVRTLECASEVGCERMCMSMPTLCAQCVLHM